MMVQQGQLLAGKFRIDRVLGQGGMGVVVAAHHVALDEEVAIKFLLPEALQNPEAVTRFEREARAAVKIRSEHVARVSDVGRLETGAPYIVMELLRGYDLGELLRQRGPLPVSEVCDYVLQAGEAIAEAHALGIVHRDLKPQNLFLTQRADGSACVKVLDFGISKMSGALLDPSMTGTSALLGSPLYMSPEQLASSRDVDARTDIWALGVICFQLLTGRPPFIADTLPQLCVAIATQAPTPLLSLRRDLPPGLEAVISRCLQHDRTQRVASVAELARELVKFAPRHALVSAERIERLTRGPSQNRFTGEATAASTFATASLEDGGQQTLGAFGRTDTSQAMQRRRIGAWLAGVAVLGMGLALAAYALQVANDGKPPSGSATTSSSAAAPVAATADAASKPKETKPDPAPALEKEPAAAPTIEPEPQAILVEPTAETRAQPLPQKRVVPPAARSAPARTAPSVAARSVKPAAQDCDIPYYYDARGVKMFKKGCL